MWVKRTQKDAERLLGKLPEDLKKSYLIQINSQCTMKLFLGYNTDQSERNQEKRVTLKDLIIRSDKDVYDLQEKRYHSQRNL
ncbi:hypothetical protein pah_c032o047 [Parachlamydia acanthamoebae str. Hall's coccus]|jgi:hypothetical protein|nr:hypothetical protein pah_c032o047 [Parachlamydia acanthamoebae str. Hall's coccus]